MGRGISGVAVGYRTSNEEALTVWTTWQDALCEHQKNVNAFRLMYDPDMRLSLHARRNIIPVYFSGDEAPEGWRRHKDGRILPDKRYKAGKEAAAKLDELRKAAPWLQLPGMPEHAFVGNHMYEMGAFKHEGAIYAYWGGMPDGVDFDIWTELKLSEFHAAAESYDPKMQA
jgi:hypothetical protein